MNEETLFLKRLPSGKQVKRYLSNAIAVLVLGVVQILDSPDRLNVFRDLVARLRRVICIEDAAFSNMLAHIEVTLKKLKLPLEFVRYEKDQNGNTRVVSIFSKYFDEEDRISPPDFMVIALIATYNEWDVIESVITSIS